MVVKKNIKKREKSAIQVAKRLKAKSIRFLNYQNLTTDSDLKLKMTKDLSDLIKKINPNIIYTHSSKDLNVNMGTSGPKGSSFMIVKLSFTSSNIVGS